MVGMGVAGLPCATAELASTALAAIAAAYRSAFVIMTFPFVRCVVPFMVVRSHLRWKGEGHKTEFPCTIHRLR